MSDHNVKEKDARYQSRLKHLLDAALPLAVKKAALVIVVGHRGPNISAFSGINHQGATFIAEVAGILCIRTWIHFLVKRG